MQSIHEQLSLPVHCIRDSFAKFCCSTASEAYKPGVLKLHFLEVTRAMIGVGQQQGAQHARFSLNTSGAPHQLNRTVHARWSGSAPNCRRRSRLVRCGAVVQAPSWREIEQAAGSDVLKGFVLRPGQAPGTAPHSVLPTERITHSPDKPVVLYRDTNAWCPFCERVRTAIRDHPS